MIFIGRKREDFKRFLHCLLSIVQCPLYRSLERYKRESQPKSQSQVITHSQNGRPNHLATEIAVVQSSSSSNHYETPLTEIPHREYERIGPHNRVITAERESTRFYDNSLHWCRVSDQEPKRASGNSELPPPAMKIVDTCVLQLVGIWWSHPPVPRLWRACDLVH